MLTEQRDFREDIDERLREEAIFAIIRQELTEREARCFLARVIDERTFENIGLEHKVTRQRIRQIILKATGKLRNPKRTALFIKVGGPLGMAAEKRFKEESKCS